MKKYYIGLHFLFTFLATYAQEIQDNELDQLSLRYAKSSFDEFINLLSLPNDAHFPNDIKKNIQWCELAFANRGFITKKLTTGGIPLILANKNYKNA